MLPFRFWSWSDLELWASASSDHSCGVDGVGRSWFGLVYHFIW